jgi:hypothetical protein
MPVYEFSTPGGKTYEFDAPDQQAALNAFGSVYQPTPIDPFPLANVPHYAAEEARAGLGRIGEGAQRLYESFRHPKPAAPLPTSLSSLGEFASEAFAPESVRAVGEMAGGAAQWAGSLPGALYHAVVGQPIGQATERGAFNLGAPPQTAHQIGEFTGNLAEAAASFYAPETRIGPLAPRAPKFVEPPVMKEGTILSKGQASGDPVQLAWENRARQGMEGEQAQKAVQAFDAVQEQSLAARTQEVQRGLDPQRREQPPVPTPREAGEVAQQAVQEQAQRADQLTDTLFARARDYDTQVEAGVFRRMGSGIRRDVLENVEPGAERVIIDRSQTPYANAMIDDLNRQPEALARRLGQRIPEGQTIAALPLEMVDRIRRSLMGLRRGAAAAARGGRYEDLRASQAVIDAFDSRIDQAIERGLYSGDPRGIQAWKDARAAHADFRTQFTRFSRDPTSKTMEKIVGGEAREPIIAEEVAKNIYGANILKPTSDNVAMARRFQRMLDPEQWGQVQQAHFQKLNESGNHEDAANNIDEFLRHSMANVMYTAPQRDMLRAYADLRRSLHSKSTVGVPTQVRSMLDRIGQRALGWTGAVFGHAIGAGVGALAGHPVIGSIGSQLGGVAGRAIGERVGAALPGARAARRAARDLRIVNNAWGDYATAVQAYEKNPTARNAARLVIRTRNLDHNLRYIGTTFQEMQGEPTQQAPPAARQVPALPPGVMGGAPLGGALSGGTRAE